jgi:peptidoglycan/LPS O-acetylase OafA/YrhL
LKIFFKNIPALRFLCFFSAYLFISYKDAVSQDQNNFIYEIMHFCFRNGNIGVNFFLVLCGFLITFLLEKEKDAFGKIDWKKYLMRRILRIWPLFFLSVAFGFLIFPQIKLYFGQSVSNKPNFIYYLFFINNFDFLIKGFPYPSNLAGMWTTAIQEQFYIIWLLVSILLHRKTVIPFSILIVVSSLIFRFEYNSRIVHELHTFSCFNDLMIGSLGAYYVCYDKNIEKVKHWSKTFIVCIYVTFASIYLFRNYLFFQSPILLPFDKLFVSIPIIFIILEQNFSDNSLFKLSSFKPLTYLGNMSYGLYCFHFIALYIVNIAAVKILPLQESPWRTSIIIPIFGFFVTVIISMVSYKFIEKPLLNFKKKYSIIKTSEL